MGMGMSKLLVFGVTTITLFVKVMESVLESLDRSHLLLTQISLMVRFTSAWVRGPLMHWRKDDILNSHWLFQTLRLDILLGNQVIPLLQIFQSWIMIFQMNDGDLRLFLDPWIHVIVFAHGIWVFVRSLQIGWLGLLSSYLWRSGYPNHSPSYL